MTKLALTLMAIVAAAGLVAATFGTHSEAEGFHRAFNPCPTGFHFKAGFCR